MDALKRKFKIAGLGVKDKDYNAMPWGRQLEYREKIEAFKAAAKKTHISQKRRTHAKAWKEFIELHQPDQWFATFLDGQQARDDVFEVFYTTKE